MIAFKLFRVRKTGTIGSLFINRSAVIDVGVWVEAEDHRTKNYAHRPGWHVCAKPEAPHLSLAGRVWYEVEIDDYQAIHRPQRQGGTWYLAQRMRVIRPLAVGVETVNYRRAA